MSTKRISMESTSIKVNRTMPKAKGWVQAMCLSMWFASCGVHSPLPEGLPPLPASAAAPSTAVVLSPGDRIEIKFRYWPELDQEQVIRPDGKISLQIVDDVTAAGMTPEQLDHHLTELYETEIRDPVITVIVRDLANRVIYVSGEVRNPGLIPLNKDKVTVLEAIMEAGGFDKRSAKIDNVVVIRHVDNVRYVTMVNIEEMMERPESEPFYVPSKDIVFVPRTRIDSLNQWVEQYISRMVPSTPLNFLYEINDRTVIGYSP